MAAGIELRSELQRSLAFGGISAAYAQIGTDFDHAIRMLLVQNLTDALLQFSFDGVIDHFPLPAGGLFVLDVTTNAIQNAQGFFISIGTKFSVKSIGTPTSGSVYVTTFYAKGS